MMVIYPRITASLPGKNFNLTHLYVCFFSDSRIYDRETLRAPVSRSKVIILKIELFNFDYSSFLKCPQPVCSSYYFNILLFFSCLSICLKTNFDFG